jgi:hydrogenase nickel incorporation protein HypA/HybF
MHELSIADTIVNTVLEEMKKRNIASVTTVGLRIGFLTDVVPEALQFGFEVLIADTPLAGTRLKIERIPVKGVCRACHDSFEVEDFVFVCPACYSTDIEMTQGDELDIAYLEVESNNNESPTGKEG